MRIRAGLGFRDLVSRNLVCSCVIRVVRVMIGSAFGLSAGKTLVVVSQAQQRCAGTGF